MAEVFSVKSIDQVNLISHLLAIRCSAQMADIWNVGLNLALRISDLLAVRFEDIKNNTLIICESKTGKVARIKLNNKALTIIQRIQKQHPLHVYLFQSYRNQQSLYREPKPLTRRAVAKAFALVGE